MASEYPDALPAGYRLEEFEIVHVLGQGGFAITYLAKDNYRNEEVALKEYYPCRDAMRISGVRVVPRPGSRKTFDWGYRRFLDEAQTQAKFRHPNIPVLHRYFRANGTAYVAMEYVKGSSLSEVLGSRGSLPLREWRPWLDRLLDALEHVHSHDYLHRDITPRNILIREKDDQPVLIDFGAARIAVGDRTRTVVLTKAYAPPEQGSARAKQGPYTDIYALGAVSYQVLTGDLPATPSDRAAGEEHKPLAERLEKAANWVAAVDRALCLRPKERPQRAAAWRKELNKAAVEMWLQSRPGRTTGAEGLTPLHGAAAAEPIPAVVAALLDRGADVNSRGPLGGVLAPLHYAAWRNRNPAVVALLLDRGASLQAESLLRGLRPLHFAAAGNQDPAVVGLLLDRGEDIGATVSSGETSLHLAAQHNTKLYVLALALSGVAQGDDFEAVLRTARGHNAKPEVVALLLDRGAEIEARDREGRTPLHYAAASQHNTATMAALVDHGASIQAQDGAGHSSLHYAAASFNEEVLTAMLRTSSDQARTQLARGRETTASLAFLLAHGANIHAQNREGWTALHVAASGASPFDTLRKPNPDAVAVLLERGANVRERTLTGETPLDLALALEGNAEAVALLNGYLSKG